MKRLLYIAISIVMAGCSSIEQLAIDYMLPAEVSFPPALRRVAVVNNAPPARTDQMVVVENTNYYNGDASLATEALAEALAAENYFDEVIICDSALRSNDTAPREGMLQPDEVTRLTEALGADFLIALENIQFSAQRKITHIEEWNTYLGTTDAKVYSSVRIYLPGRRGPMTTLNEQDSIFWEVDGNREDYVRALLISDKELIRQASRFGGSMPVSKLLPTWKTSPRYLFTGGSVHMRDAAVYAREQQWEEAVSLWQHTYDSKKREKQKMMAAYNLAVGYEMLDQFDQALQWAQTAQTLAKPKDEAADASYYNLITQYILELQQRKAGLPRLEIQMLRFRADF